MSVAKLRLASRPTLEDLEANQGQQATRHRLHQPSLAKSPVPESRLPKVHCHTAQVLYAKDMQRNYPEWKRWAVNNLYLPVFRFLHKRWGIAPPSGKDAEGREIWVSHQGCFLTREEAEADAKRYPHGYVVPNMPLGNSLTADVAKESSIYVPNKGEKAVPTTDMLSEINEARQEAAKVRAAVQSARAF